METKTVSTGITRFSRGQGGSGDGFMVRISRNGKRINEFFSVARCGGIRKARQAADARYAELCDQLGPASHSTKGKLTNRNESGKVGVYVAYSADSRYPNCEYWAYCASWTDADGQRRKINFSWNKYGEEQAWDLACLARDREISDRDEVLRRYTRTQRRRAKSS